MAYQCPPHRLIPRLHPRQENTSQHLSTINRVTNNNNYSLFFFKKNPKNLVMIVTLPLASLIAFFRGLHIDPSARFVYNRAPLVKQH